MSKIYFVRHQASGILVDYPFAAPPTKEQQDAIARLCFQSHGDTHPKTKEPYWLTVVETAVLGASDVPTVPERALGVAGAPGVNAAGVQAFGVSGVGAVTPPAKK